jgi:ketose-bisphosphate aldolase
MIDGSSLSFEENVALTKKVVDFAHQKNVSVEGEIGRLGVEGLGNATSEGTMSVPDEVAKFIELTGVDSVAVSVGNIHGAPEGEKLNLELLKEISSKVSIPLVLHGSSGLSAEDIKAARALRVSKINVDTAIRQEFIDSLQDIPEGTDDYRDVFKASMDAIKKLVIEKIILFVS